MAPGIVRAQDIGDRQSVSSALSTTLEPAAQQFPGAKHCASDSPGSVPPSRESLPGEGGGKLGVASETECDHCIETVPQLDLSRTDKLNAKPCWE